MSNLAAPAALIGGAAIASFFELKEELAPYRSDKASVRLVKYASYMFLLSSFVLEITCIFSVTITGTMLLGNEDRILRSMGINSFAISPMGMMGRELEFEFLLIRCTLFQGLLNWLLGLAMVFFARAAYWGGCCEDRPDPRRDVRCIRHLALTSGFSIVTLVFMMLAFYNNHMAFHSNYLDMWQRLMYLALHRYIVCWPPRVLPIIAILPLGCSLLNLVRGIMAFARQGDGAASSGAEGQ